MPCHRRWSSRLNIYVDRRDKIVVNHHLNEGNGSCERVYTHVLRIMLSSSLAMKLLITTTLVSRHRRARLKMMYWQHVDWSVMTIVVPVGKANLDICLSLFCVVSSLYDVGQTEDRDGDIQIPDCRRHHTGATCCPNKHSYSAIELALVWAN